MVPAKVVSLSDHKTTLPPLPRPRADALMVVAASTLTVVAVGITKLSSLALGLDTRPLFGLPPPQSPPISTLPPPARPEASTRALASLMFSPVTRMMPPCVPFLLARPARRAGDLAGRGGGARRLGCPGGGAEHDHAVAPADRVGRDHAAGVDDGIDYGACRRGGELDPSAVGSDFALVAHQRLERLAGRDVAHLRGDLVADGERDQLVAVEVQRETGAGYERHGAERRGDGAGVAHAGPDQAAGGGGDPPLIDDRRIRRAGDVEIISAGHEVRVFDVVGGGEEARRVHHGVGTEQDAVAVDDEYPAVRRQRAEDLRRS